MPDLVEHPLSALASFADHSNEKPNEIIHSSVPGVDTEMGIQNKYRFGGWFNNVYLAIQICQMDGYFHEPEKAALCQQFSDMVIEMKSREHTLINPKNPAEKVIEVTTADVQKGESILNQLLVDILPK